MITCLANAGNTAGHGQQPRFISNAIKSLFLRKSSKYHNIHRDTVFKRRPSSAQRFHTTNRRMEVCVGHPYNRLCPSAEKLSMTVTRVAREVTGYSWYCLECSMHT